MIKMQFIGIAFVYMTSLFSLTMTQSVSSGSTECCSRYMMDATGLVAIETQRPLISNLAAGATLRALRVRACTNEPIAVQIWRRLDDSTYQFRFQSQITANIVYMGRNYVTVNFDTTPIDITPDDRLGLYSPMTSSKLATPFTSNPSSSYLQLSTTRFNDFSAFIGGTTVTLDDTVWQRTFSASVEFCTQVGCADLTPITTPSPPVGPGGIPGLPGPAGSCCTTPPIQCDATDVTNTLTNQTGRVIELQNTITVITRLINDIFGSRLVTGTCPQGFTPGTYGVGKCYIMFRDPVPMALGVLRCRDDFQARLLTIESLEEDMFLREFIGNNTLGNGIENFWTSGMYNRPTNTWYWYDESTRTRTNQVYSNWEGRTPPTANSDSDVCSTYTMNLGTNRYYWNKQVCTSQQFYICEQPKTCL